ncbi:type II toxin-antitoxin system HipA family toxin [Candidatus Viadribacter manganicus]|uniref:Phosphatidylinositol kinase n=1 Tax=Candidatus Viadribacter manganicus TaxID=1759059 RepID=A0A1B1AH68_9PROT|nr:type II toxin-antitoxin system HipA family toxin [Candidatus Viadribacter manganicus]ANP45904.1 phosphatidylinositol kinase [Candidatus Viadribacter manganicus]
MKLPLGAPLRVSLEFSSSRPRLRAARLAMDKGVAQLEWSPELIASALNLAGLNYPPAPGLHAARTHSFNGLHGFLADALPEGWGHLVMRKRLAKLGVDIASLTAVEQLALVGDAGRGALVFEPATAPSDEVETLDLDALADDAAAILSGDDGELAETLARLAGGSGGARPKVHVGFDDEGHISVGSGEIAPGHSAWIVKFRAPEDPVDIGPLEYAYASMARSAHIDVPDHRLIESAKRPGYFAARRFDRPEPGVRLHMLSLSGAIESPPQTPSSYDTLLRATRAMTRRAEDVAMIVRRMLFNVLAHNRDDHTRQHAFLMDDRGDWRLSPAYDLTYAAGPGGEHYLDVEGEGRTPTRGHVEALASRHGLSDKQTAAAIDDVRSAVSGWNAIAKSVGVSAATRKLVAEAHERVWANF